MKKCLLFFLTLFVSSFAFGQERFRTIPFSHTPLHLFRGGVSIDPIDSSVATYQFDYQDDLLIKVSYLINGKAKPLYENYTCSDFVWASINSFEYTEDSIVVRHYDYLGKPVESNPAISVYYKDESNRVVGLRYFDEQHVPAEFRGVHRYRWKYFEEGVGEVRFSKAGDVVRISNWLPYDWVIMTFDEKKSLKTLLTTNTDWQKAEGAVKIEFETNGTEITRWVAKTNQTERRTNQTGPKVSEVRHDFNENGYLTRTRFYDTDGNRTISAWGHSGFQRVYNSLGNRMKYHFIDETDEIEISERGYSGQKFSWDQEGRLRLQSAYIDEEENPVFRQSRGFASVHYVYNHQGEEIGKIYRDENDRILNTEQAPSFILLENQKGEREKVGF